MNTPSSDITTPASSDATLTKMDSKLAHMVKRVGEARTHTGQLKQDMSAALVNDPKRFQELAIDYVNRMDNFLEVQQNRFAEVRALAAPVDLSEAVSAPQENLSADSAVFAAPKPAKDPSEDIIDLELAPRKKSGWRAAALTGLAGTMASFGVVGMGTKMKEDAEKPHRFRPDSVQVEPPAGKEYPKPVTNIDFGATASAPTSAAERVQLEQQQKQIAAAWKEPVAGMKYRNIKTGRIFQVDAMGPYMESKKASFDGEIAITEIVRNPHAPNNFIIGGPGKKSRNEFLRELNIEKILVPFDCNRGCDYECPTGIRR